MRKLVIFLALLGIGTMFASALSYADTPTPTPPDAATVLVQSVVDGMKNIVDKYGEPATQLALASVQLSCVQNLVNGQLGVLCLLLTWWVTLKASNWIIQKKQKHIYGDWDMLFIPLTVIVIVMALGSLAAASELTSVKNYYGLYHPEVVLASDVVHKVLN